MSIDTKATGCLSMFSQLGSGQSQGPEYFVLLVLDHLIVLPSTSRSKSQHNVIVAKLYLGYDHVIKSLVISWRTRWEYRVVFSSTRNLYSKMNRLFGRGKPKEPPPNLTDAISNVSISKSTWMSSSQMSTSTYTYIMYAINFSLGWQ